MIQGTKYWNDRYYYYIQTNNPTEALLKKRGVKGFLESCGPTSCINCLASMGYNVDINTPGTYKPQPEEVLIDFFLDPANIKIFNNIRPDIDNSKELSNRVPQYYPYAAKQVFNANAEFFFSNLYTTIIDIVKSGLGIQACLKKPGHYIAILAYDDATGELIYNDSWPERHSDNDGFNKRMTQNEFNANVQNFFIKYKEQE